MISMGELRLKRLPKEKARENSGLDMIQTHAKNQKYFCITLLHRLHEQMRKVTKFESYLVFEPLSQILQLLLENVRLEVKSFQS